MHVHQSIVDPVSGQNFLQASDGLASPLFLSYIAGLQIYSGGNADLRAERKFLPPAHAVFQTRPSICNGAMTTAPAAARAFRRSFLDAGGKSRAGADANPYLAFAATLACGYLGMVEKLEPTAAQIGSAYSGE